MKDGGISMKDGPAVVEMLKALADESRLRMLSLLLEAGDLCSCEIEKILLLKQSNTSRHLYRLRSSGLLESYRQAQWIHYRLANMDAEKRTRGGELLYAIISSARESDGIFSDDIERLHDYRDRGFSCATIHEWVPVKMTAGI